MENRQYKDIRSKIENLYSQILLREADKEGLEYWIRKMVNEEMTLNEVKAAFYNSREYEQLDSKYDFTNDKTIPRGFFDDYPKFFKTSKTFEHPNHLNGRYKSIIEFNRKIICGSSILDIASHDGRWSFAALKNGATKVVGIEAREHLVNNSIENMKEYGIDKNLYEFIKEDIHTEITKFQQGEFDVIFCLDFLYHTLDHWFLLSQIKRLNPKYLVIDTRIDWSNENIVRLHMDNPEKEAHASSIDNSKNKILVGCTSKPALEMMLTCLGFTDFKYFDWRKNILNFRNLVDYYHGKRVTLTATNNSM